MNTLDTLSPLGFCFSSACNIFQVVSLTSSLKCQLFYEKFYHLHFTYLIPLSLALQASSIISFTFYIPLACYTFYPFILFIASPSLPSLLSYHARLISSFYLHFSEVSGRHVLLFYTEWVNSVFGNKSSGTDKTSRYMKWFSGSEQFWGNYSSVLQHNPLLNPSSAQPTIQWQRLPQLYRTAWLC